MSYSEDLTNYRKFKAEAIKLYNLRDLEKRRKESKRLAVKYKTNVNSVFDIFNKLEMVKRN